MTLKLETDAAAGRIGYRCRANVRSSRRIAADPVSTEDLQDDGYLEEKYKGADLDISKAEAEAGPLTE